MASGRNAATFLAFIVCWPLDQVWRSWARSASRRSSSAFVLAEKIPCAMALTNCAISCSTHCSRCRGLLVLRFPSPLMRGQQLGRFLDEGRLAFFGEQVALNGLQEQAFDEFP